MIDPSVWGPALWKSIHIIALAYPDDPSQEDATRYKNFFHAFEHVIPCQVCRAHYAENLRSYPIEPHLKSKHDLFSWTVEVHNLVNEQTRKEKISVAEAYAIYLDLKPEGPGLGKDSLDHGPSLGSRKDSHDSLDHGTSRKDSLSKGISEDAILAFSVGLSCLLASILVAYAFFRRTRQL